MRLFVLIIFAVSFVTLSAWSDESEFIDMKIPSHVTLDVGASSGGSSSLNLDAGFALNSGHLVGIGVGGTQLKSDNRTLKTNSLRASFQTDPIEEWSYGINGESWGAREKLVVNSVRGDVTWTPTDWEFSLDPEYRVINWFLETGARRRYQSTSFATHARITYYGFSKSRLTMTGGSYRYSESLDTAFNSGLVFEESLDLASGFPKNYIGCEYGYNFGKWSLGVGVVTTRYEYDDSLSRTGFLKSYVNLSKNYSLGLEVGNTASDASKNSYSNMSITYSW